MENIGWLFPKSSHIDPSLSNKKTGIWGISRQTERVYRALDDRFSRKAYHDNPTPCTQTNIFIMVRHMMKYQEIWWIMMTNIRKYEMNNIDIWIHTMIITLYTCKKQAFPVVFRIFFGSSGAIASHSSHQTAAPWRVSLESPRRPQRSMFSAGDGSKFCTVL